MAVTSPRDWTLHRNDELPKMRWKSPNADHSKTFDGQVVKTEGENVWRLEERCGTERRWVGMMAVYVDDVLTCGEQTSVANAIKAVQDVWALSAVDWVSSTSLVKFCGFESRQW